MKELGESFLIAYPHAPIDAACDDVCVMDVEDPDNPVPDDSFILELDIEVHRRTSAVKLQGENRWVKLLSTGRYRVVQEGDDQILNADITDVPSPAPPPRHLLSTQPIAIPPGAWWTVLENNVRVLALTFHEYAPAEPDLEPTGSEIPNPETGGFVYTVRAPKDGDLRGSRVRVVWQRKPIKIDSQKNL
jgi:hypothetical protein